MTNPSIFQSPEGKQRYIDSQIQKAKDKLQAKSLRDQLSKSLSESENQTKSIKQQQPQSPNLNTDQLMQQDLAKDDKMDANAYTNSAQQQISNTQSVEQSGILNHSSVQSSPGKQSTLLSSSQLLTRSLDLDLFYQKNRKLFDNKTNEKGRLELETQNQTLKNQIQKIKMQNKQTLLISAGALAFGLIVGFLVGRKQ